MIKVLYCITISLYIVMAIGYFSRYEISYRMVKVRPELVETRDLTNAEHAALDRAFILRTAITNWFIFFSLIVALFSAAILYFHLFNPRWLLKVLLGVSLFWFVVLLLIKGIHFIPNPPIR